MDSGFFAKSTDGTALGKSELCYCETSSLGGNRTQTNRYKNIKVEHGKFNK